MIPKELLKILACPCCKGDLVLDRKRLVCKKCNKSFEIREGVPILVCDE